MSEEKKPTRAQIFRYFRIESRNNNILPVITFLQVFVKLWGFKICHFGQFGKINARYILRY